MSSVFNKLSEIHDENDELRKALEFYASRESYLDGYSDLGTQAPDVLCDGGQIARKALGIKSVSIHNKT